MKTQTPKSRVRLIAALPGAGADDIDVATFPSDIFGRPARLEPAGIGEDGLGALLAAAADGGVLLPAIYRDPDRSPFFWAGAFARIPERLAVWTGLKDWILRESERRGLLRQKDEFGITPLRMLPRLCRRGAASCAGQPAVPAYVSDILTYWRRNGADAGFLAFDISADLPEIDFGRSIERMPERLFVNLFGLDRVLNDGSHASPEFRAALARAGGLLRALIEQIRGEVPHFETVLFSPYRPARVRQVFDLIGELERKIYRPCRDYALFVGPVLSRFWFGTTDARLRVRAALDDAGCGATLSDARARELGLLREPPAYGETFFVAADKTVFAPNYFTRLAAPYAWGWPDADDCGGFVAGSALDGGGRVSGAALIALLRE